MSDGMGREFTYLSSHATNRYFIPNWGIYSKINAALQCNRYKERMELASETKHHVSETHNASLPSTTGHGEFFSGSLGLLNGSSSYNAADAEANQEMAEILRRKKKRKRGMRLWLCCQMVISSEHSDAHLSCEAEITNKWLGCEQ